VTPPALPVKQTVTPLPVHCAVCSTGDTATVFSVELPPAPKATWLKMPAGWWVLACTVVDPADLHCRCPGCLRKAGAPCPT
jgi:hypothetical protein